MVHTSSFWGVTGRTESHVLLDVHSKRREIPAGHMEKKLMGVQVAQVVGSPCLETLDTWAELGPEKHEAT